MTDLIEKVARGIWKAANASGEYVGDYGFPRGERGSHTTLDGDFQLSEFAKAAISTVLREMMAFSSEPSQLSKSTIESNFVRTFASQHQIDIGEWE